MKQRNNRSTMLYFAVAGAVLTAYAAIRAAPFFDRGIIWILTNLDAVLFSGRMVITDETVKLVLGAEMIYSLSVLYYMSSRKNRRRGEEYGSAKWGDARVLNKKYSQDMEHDRILTANCRIGYDSTKHERNLFTCVVGGSGAKKTRGYVIPNILQMSGSMVILDPKGENVRATGRVLEDNGYDVKVLDLIHMEKSFRYNPFHYIRCENDIQRVATILFNSTGTKDAKPNDPYWENAASEILVFFMMYLWYEAPEEEQNFGMVMDMVRLLGSGEDENEKNKKNKKTGPIELLYKELKCMNPEHPALRYYEDFVGVPNKTLQTIKSTLTGKLNKFNLNEVISLTYTDELDIDSLGRKKTAIFCVIPDMDTSFNFLVSIFYMQAFQRLAYIADNEYHGPLPVNVHFLMDEFANVALPNDFEKVQSTIRSRGVSMSIILQNYSQIKALFEKQYESILGNCDTLIYLGGNEQSSHEYISKLLDKETLDTNTYGKSHGMHGNFSTNDQQAGRELLTPGEIRMLDNDYCIMLIRGERPVLDRKYDLLSHPLIGKTCLAKKNKAKPYTYGESEKKETTFELLGYMDVSDVPGDERVKALEGDYEVITEETMLE